MVRPDYEGITKNTPKSFLPPAPELTYSKHTLPHFMNNNNPEKYFKSGEKYTQTEISVFYFPQLFWFYLELNIVVVGCLYVIVYIYFWCVWCFFLIYTIDQATLIIAIVT